jgi:hypothetical protein
MFVKGENIEYLVRFPRSEFKRQHNLEVGCIIIACENFEMLSRKKQQVYRNLTTRIGEIKRIKV